MKLPQYLIVEGIPVKAFSADEGGMDVHAYNLKTGIIERNMDYLDEVIFSSNLQTNEVDKDVFERHVIKLQAGRRGNKEKKTGKENREL